MLPYWPFMKHEQNKFPCKSFIKPFLRKMFYFYKLFTHFLCSLLHEWGPLIQNKHVNQSKTLQSGRLCKPVFCTVSSCTAFQILSQCSCCKPWQRCPLKSAFSAPPSDDMCSDHSCKPTQTKRKFALTSHNMAVFLYSHSLSSALSSLWSTSTESCSVRRRNWHRWSPPCQMAGSLNRWLETQ